MPVVAPVLLPMLPEVELEPPTALPPMVPEPRLPLELPPAAPVELPNCWMQRSRSSPVRPTHWLGNGALAPALELVLPPTLELAPGVVLGLGVALGVVEVLAPVLVLEVPEVLVCAHEALATPTKVAATATAIALTITMKSPES